MFEKNFFKINPYYINNNFYSKIFLSSIRRLTKHHYNKCKYYAKIINKLNFNLNKNYKLDNLPMIPVRLFKHLDLLSVSKNKIIKTLVSSGTSGNKVSKIYLDKFNSANQVKVLKNLIEDILGKKRLPMIIVDSNPKYSNRLKFSAKTAAIVGFSYFGNNHFYLLDKNGNIDYQGLNNFLKKFSKKNFFVFGFTSFIYQILIKKLLNKKIKYNFKNAIFLHGGGWKNSEQYNIKKFEFKSILLKKLRIKKIYNYYGMVEQTGSIFLECNKCGGFRTSRYSDIIIRDKNFNKLDDRKLGMIQLLSNIPTSYPGHNILTEDMGEIINNGNGKCGFKGKCFVVHGRLKKAEIRGCSDVR